MVSAYTAVSEHVKLTRGLRVGVLSLFPQECGLLYAAARTVQDDVDDSVEEDGKDYPQEFRGLALLFLLVKKRLRRHPWRGLASSRRRAANLARLLTQGNTRPSPFTFPKSPIAEAFVCPGKGFNSGMSIKRSAGSLTRLPINTHSHMCETTLPCMLAKLT